MLTIHVVCCPFFYQRHLLCYEYGHARAVNYPQKMSSEMCISYHTPSFLSRTNTNIKSVVTKIIPCTCEIQVKGNFHLKPHYFFLPNGHIYNLEQKRSKCIVLTLESTLTKHNMPEKRRSNSRNGKYEALRAKKNLSKNVTYTRNCFQQDLKDEINFDIAVLFT